MLRQRNRTNWKLLTSLLVLVLTCFTTLPTLAQGNSTDYASGTITAVSKFPPQVGDAAGVNARWRTVEFRRDGSGRYFIGSMDVFASYNSITTPSNPIPLIDHVNFTNPGAVKVGSAFRVRVQKQGRGNGLFTVDFYAGSQVDPNKWVGDITFVSGLARGTWPWSGTPPVIANKLVFKRAAGKSSQTISYWAGSSLPGGGGGPVPFFVNPPQPAWVDIPLEGSHTIHYTHLQPIKEQNIFFHIIVDNDRGKPIGVISAKLHGNGEITDVKSTCPSSSQVGVKTFKDHIEVTLPEEIPK